MTLAESSSKISSTRCFAFKASRYGLGVLALLYEVLGKNVDSGSQRNAFGWRYEEFSLWRVTSIELSKWLSTALVDCKDSRLSLCLGRKSGTSDVCAVFID